MKNYPKINSENHSTIQLKARPICWVGSCVSALVWVRRVFRLLPESRLLVTKTPFKSIYFFKSFTNLCYRWHQRFFAGNENNYVTHNQLPGDFKTRVTLTDGPVVSLGSPSLLPHVWTTNQSINQEDIYTRFSQILWSKRRKPPQRDFCFFVWANFNLKFFQAIQLLTCVMMMCAETKKQLPLDCYTHRFSPLQLKKHPHDYIFFVVIHWKAIPKI